MQLPIFVDHLVFRVADVERSASFYRALLGQKPDFATDSAMFQVGETRLFFTLRANARRDYDKESVGLNHLAFGVRSGAELREIEARLNHSQIAHSGIKIDHYGNMEFIWLNDPDGIRVEFYVRPA